MEDNYLFLIERRKEFGYNCPFPEEKIVYSDPKLKEIKESSAEQISNYICKLIASDKKVEIYKVTNLPYFTGKSPSRIKRILGKTTNVSSVVFSKAGISVYGEDSDLEKIAELVEEYRNPGML